jgi:hypothetical protein
MSETPPDAPDPGHHLETLSEASERLQARGFAESFAARAGRLATSSGERTFRPDELDVVEMLRFEGASDPADASILFALQTPDGSVRGLYSAVYGPSVSPEDAEVIQALDAADRPARRGDPAGGGRLARDADPNSGRTTR